jgi:hypothetical protein
MDPNPSIARDTSAAMAHRPVVVLTEEARLDVVLAGVRRAGGDPDVRTAPWIDPGSLLEALSAAPEVAVVVCGAPEAAAVILAVRALGARPIPVLAFVDGDEGPAVSPSARSLIADPRLEDLEIPVPSVEDDAMRRQLWDQLRDVRAEERHHLVEVDGRPALADLAERGTPPSDDWASRAAGAAGVLAGRLAASNRRWRAQLDT